TVADVFPDEKITTADGAVYPRIGQPQENPDCRGAATLSDVRTRLASAGCTQVIRASYASPDSKYFLTAGILNLPSLADANTFARDVASLATADKGTLAGYISDPSVQVLITGPARLLMEARGHFLLYTVIVRKDNKKMDDTDTTGLEIISGDI